MESSGPPAEDILLQRPWLPVSISGCQLLTKSWFGETAYRVLLTDMHCVWEERMDAAAIQSRAQELNRRLRAPVKAFFSHLCDVAQPCLSADRGPPQNEAQISLTRQEDGDILMRLKSELAGLPFYWEFHCTPAPITLACSQLVRPLLAMSRLLQQQVEQLAGLLVRKDAEIQDYRENGATLSRERLQTDAFEEQTYKENFMAKALPLLWTERQDALGFDADLQQLYAAVVHRSARKRKLSEDRCEEEEEEEEEDRPAPALTSPPGAPDRLCPPEPADRDPHPTHVRQEDTSGAKMADRPTVQQHQSRPAASERPSSRPKKKKVGLFG
ncbi:non-homologous end-joining factor 1 [Parambassis ranga]|uniref:Non-homologous end-joining factor 1 n=1 Tax=Parambassis ranga TaxID=210632 RepID=A0A6P7HU52_9TELE|nr:non-homologous end-joining factor 1 [Parambassis ranga]XP_028255612.1 non-homologous end-joining factor 1 [Parambassis ranga]